jgi:hypothetical protein
MTSFFEILFNRKNLKSHDFRSLWKYQLDGEDYNQLFSTLKFSKKSSIDKREVAMYYAQRG